jgi:hypothetical protein
LMLENMSVTKPKPSHRRGQFDECVLGLLDSKQSSDGALDKLEQNMNIWEAQQGERDKFASR